MTGFLAAVTRHYWPWLGLSIVAGGFGLLAAGMMPGLLEYTLGAVLILAVAGAWLAAVLSMVLRAFKQNRASEIVLQCSLIVLVPSMLVLALPYILP